MIYFIFIAQLNLWKYILIELSLKYQNKIYFGRGENGFEYNDDSNGMSRIE